MLRPFHGRDVHDHEQVFFSCVHLQPGFGPGQVRADIFPFHIRGIQHNEPGIAFFEIVVPGRAEGFEPFRFGNLVVVAVRHHIRHSQPVPGRFYIGEEFGVVVKEVAVDHRHIQPAAFFSLFSHFTIRWWFS